METFVTISDEYESVDIKFEDNVVITRSFTSNSHFEKDTVDVLNMYKAITGKELNLEPDEEKQEGQ